MMKDIIERLQQAELSLLGQHFARFCAEQDPDADGMALITAAVLAHRNTHGDTCLALSDLAGQPLLRDKDDAPLVTAPDIDAWRRTLACRFVGEPDDYRPLILDGSRLYLHRHWREEQVIDDALQMRMVGEESDPARLRERLDALFDTSTPEKKERTLGQKVAATMALTRRLSIITGGPGTGKTTTVTKILALLLEQQPSIRILLAAPTGKAAARLAESIDEQVSELKGLVDTEILDRLPRQASTIHRLLGWQRQSFAHHAENPLPCDCLLLDETSMIDQGLMASLLQAMPRHCRLILLGDRDQLESVEAGKVLGDITGHGEILTLSPKRAVELAALLGEEPPVETSADTSPIADHIAHLTYSHRFAKGGGIGRLAEAVNEGDSVTASTLLTEGDPELGWIETIGKQPSSKIIDWACERYKPIFDADSPTDALARFETTRVLTALRIGPWGETAIGEQIEARLCSQGMIPSRADSPYQGLPIIIRRNDRETGLFNGDTGIFWFERDDMPMAWLHVNGELRNFSVHLLPEWQPAWTLTVHRSQGSQYSEVMLVLPPEESRVVTRELIYTGLTRAQRHCAIAATREPFEKAIETRQPRHSGLAARLGWLTDE